MGIFQITINKVYIYSQLVKFPIVMKNQWLLRRLNKFHNKIIVFSIIDKKNQLKKKDWVGSRQISLKIMWVIPQ